MYLQNKPVRKIFTLKNAKEYEEGQGHTVLSCVWDSEEYKEQITMLIKEADNFYRLISYHIDAFFRDAARFDFEYIEDLGCVSEINLTDTQIKHLFKEVKK